MRCHREIWIGILALMVFATTSRAALVANWAFQTNPPTAATNIATNGTYSPDAGSGSANGVHASASTNWTAPGGNGSTISWASSNWAIGDYYQFQVSLAGMFDPVLEWDMTRSSTGSSGFKLQYSNDGSSFTDFSTFTVLENLSGNGGTWNNTTRITNYITSADLSAINVLDGDASVFFRLTATSAPGGTAGTVRVDNFSVNATPEPNSLIIVALAGLMTARRRR